MNNQDLFERIESPLFQARLGVVSGLVSFMDALATTTEAKELLEAIKTPETAWTVFRQGSTVTNRAVDANHENPWDIALAAYLWAMDKVDDVLANALANLVLACPGCWWSRKLAEKIRSQPHSSAESGNLQKVYHKTPANPDF